MVEAVSTNEQATATPVTAPQTSFTGLTPSGQGATTPAVDTAAPKDKAPETGATPAVNEPVEVPKKKPEASTFVPATQQAEEKSSKFLDTAYGDLLREAWRLRQLDPEFEKALEGGKIKQKKDGLEFTLANGHKFNWNVDQEGNEFIGMSGGLFSRMDQQDARAMTAAALAHGWKSVAVQGSPEEKEMLWLEAQRLGLEVSNYQPPITSNAYKVWQEEKSLYQHGLAPAQEPQAPTGPETTAETPEADTTDAPATETPAAAEATAETPAETAAAENPGADATVAENDAPAAETPATEAAVEEPATETPAAAEATAETPAETAAAENPGADATVAENDAPAAETPATEAAVEEPATDAPAVEKPATAAATTETPAAEAAEEKPATDAPAAETPAATETTAEAPAAKTDAPAADAPATPTQSKFGATTAATETPADKAKPAAQEQAVGDETPWRYEERMNNEATSGLLRRANEATDPALRSSMEKLHSQIQAGNIKVDGPVDREILNNADTPKGFNKAASYFEAKSPTAEKLPRLSDPDKTADAPAQKAPRTKGNGLG